jgi:hypothetical protein
VRLDDLAVCLRTRNAYEAIDLGYAMTVAWRRDVFPVWASVYLAAVVVVNLICFAKPVLATLVLWWLKPAFDRVILQVLAGAAFGKPPTTAEVWRALPRLWRGTGVLASLTWRRLDSARSFTMPVYQLEGQSGKPARARRAALGRESRGAAVWLTIASANFELLLVLSIYAFAELFLPGDIGALNPFRWWAEPPPDWLQFVSNAFSASIVLMMEPFYVAGGFALYLNTRTKLEGWDIELAFKRMSARIRASRARAEETAGWVGRRPAASGRLAAAVACLVIAASLAAAPDALAQSCRPDGSDVDVGAPENATDGGVPGNIETSSPPTAMITPMTGAAEKASAILADPMFGETRATWSLKYVGPGSSKKKEKPPSFEWLQRFGEWMAYGLRALAWGFGAAAIVGLLYVLIRKFDGGDWRSARSRPDMLFGLDVRPDSLPRDIPAAARQALAAGEARLALSLLYRGALVSLIAEGRFDISPGDTEGVCARSVDATYGGVSADKPRYFRQLVAGWQRIAYAREGVAIEEIAPLVDAWSSHFSIAGQSASAGPLGRSDMPLPRGASA